MKDILWIASKNKNKILEFSKILSQFNIKLKSLYDVNHIDDIEEIGKTIEENSLIKAKTLALILNEPVISDDTGLEIYELNNFPGVNSKRWANHVTSEHIINELLLEKCKNLKDRSARMKTVISYYNPINSVSKQFVGILKGKISDKIILGNGFGYDHVFSLPNGKLISQISLEEKNTISHRAIAMKLFIEWWKDDNEKVKNNE